MRCCNTLRDKEFFFYLMKSKSGYKFRFGIVINLRYSYQVARFLTSRLAFEGCAKLPIRTFLLLPTWYTNFLFVHTNYIKRNSSTCFEYNPPIIRRSTTQIVHMQPLVSSLSASDRLVQPLRLDCLSGCTRRSLAESVDTRGCICTICVVDLLMMSGLRSKHVEEFNLTLKSLN